MTLDDAITTLAAHKGMLDSWGVASIHVFGSVARGEAGNDSDIDLLVAFLPGRTVGLFGFARLRRQLEELLGCRVDLVTERALRDPMRAEVLQEAVLAA